MFRSIGKRVRNKYQAETEARRHIRLKRADASPRAPGRIRLEDFTKDFFNQDGDWVRRRLSRDYTFSGAMSGMRNAHLKNHILPAFGELLLADIESFAIDDWLLDLELSNGTKNSIMCTLNLVFKEAERQKIITRNPIDHIDRMANKYRPTDIFTVADIKLLFPHDDIELLEIWKSLKWALMHYLMLTAGLRCGEAGALLWRNVIWEQAGLLIMAAIKATGVIGSLKKREQNNEQRAVILPKRTVTMLKSWRDKTPFKDPDHYIFFGSDGSHHLNTKTIGRKIGPAMELAGIQPGVRKLTAHSLRHTYNTRMERVLPGEILRYMIGHKSEAMTKRYLHKAPEERLLDLVPEQKKIDEAWD